jgi:hypothetical protein
VYVVVVGIEELPAAVPVRAIIVIKNPEQVIIQSKIRLLIVIENRILQLVRSAVSTNRGHNNDNLLTGHFKYTYQCK